ncbi:hypothetical protein Aperf_G00000066606 [Anoplocephala perfoliata]
MVMIRIIATTYRWILVFFNLGMLLLGMPVCIVGIYYLTKEKDCEFWGTCGHSAYTVIIGVWIVGAGALGFFGALKRRNRLLVIYSVAMAILVAVQMGMGIFAYIFETESEYDIDSRIKESIELVKGDVDNPLIKSVEDIKSNPYVSTVFDAATGDYNVFNIVTILTGASIFQFWIAEMAFVYSCIS